MQLSKQQIKEFRKTILDFYAESGRSFPWRSVTVKPNAAAGSAVAWGVLVSEFMLQQTQTARVIPYWERWMKKWPRPKDLAAASLETVLKEWSGLGYNRRAKKLQECAAAITERYGGKVPATPEELITLPGIGPYTAGAIAGFAWNYPAIFIETNIRSVFIHFFFQDRDGIKDDELFPLLDQTLDRSNPRVWYWALMDYGAELKKITKNPNRKSAHYARQSKFEGSLRQIRGAIVKKLALEGRQSGKKLYGKIKEELELKEDDFYRALEDLQKEMLVAEDGGKYGIGPA
jgi:A/G-specific adenine glycosylase